MVMAKGGAPKNRLQEAVDAVNQELQEWDKAGLKVEGVNIVGFVLNAKVLAIFDVLEEMLGADHDKMNIIYNQRLLKELEETRAAIQPEVEEARKQALRPTELEKRLLGPDGKQIIH